MDQADEPLTAENLQATLERLEARGYIVRCGDVVRLTDKGRSWLAAHPPGTDRDLFRPDA